MLPAEVARLRKLVHQRRQPPREALGLPDAAQAAVGIDFDARRALVAIELGQARARDSRHRRLRGSSPSRRSAARCAPRRRPGTGGRSAAARPRSCAAARCSSRSTGRSSPRRATSSGSRRRSSAQNAVVGPVLDLLVERASARSSGCACGCAGCTARSRARGWRRSARRRPAARRRARRASRTDRPSRRSRIAPSGTLARHTPWKPSQPAMKSQRSSCSAPS